MSSSGISLIHRLSVCVQHEAPRHLLGLVADTRLRHLDFFDRRGVAVRATSLGPVAPFALPHAFDSPAQMLVHCASFRSHSWLLKIFVLVNLMQRQSKILRVGSVSWGIFRNFSRAPLHRRQLLLLLLVVLQISWRLEMLGKGLILLLLLLLLSNHLCQRLQLIHINLRLHNMHWRLVVVLLVIIAWLGRLGHRDVWQTLKELLVHLIHRYLILLILKLDRVISDQFFHLSAVILVIFFVFVTVGFSLHLLVVGRVERGERGQINFLRAFLFAVSR